MPGPQLAGAGEALDASLNTMISEFYMLTEERGVVRKTATPFTLAPHTGTSKIVLNYGRVTLDRLSDGVDITQGKDLADTQTSYTPAEVGGKFILPRTTLSRVADPDLFRRAGEMLSLAYERIEDRDGCDQFDDFTPIIGAAADIIGPGHVLSAAIRLSVGNTNRTATTTPEPAPKPYYGVFHPAQLSTVAARLLPLTDVPTGTNVYVPTGGATNDTVGAGRGTALADEIVKAGIPALGQLFGVPIIPTANINVDASDDASGAVYSKAGLVYVEEFSPSMEQEKDISARGVELVIAGSYVWGNYRAANYGVEMLFDASLPTS